MPILEKLHNTYVRIVCWYFQLRVHGVISMLVEGVGVHYETYPCAMEQSTLRRQAIEGHEVSGPKSAMFNQDDIGYT